MHDKVGSHLFSPAAAHSLPEIHGARSFGYDHEPAEELPPQQRSTLFSTTLKIAFFCSNVECKEVACYFLLLQLYSEWSEKDNTSVQLPESYLQT